MKRRGSFVVAGALCISLLMNGCSKKESMPMSYKDMMVTNKSQSMDFIQTNTSDYRSNQYCVVPLGEDHGGDDKITAAASLIFDITNKVIIYADHIYDRIYPASITKLMTALVVFEQCDLDEVVTVSYNASHITEAGAKLCGLKEGDQIKLGDLVTALLVYSGNDAGTAIAEHVSGSVSVFAKLMNETAKRIGAVDSHFVNPHGLHDENHYTTAYDLYLIFQQFLQYDQGKEMIQKANFTMNYQDANGNTKQLYFVNTNKYLMGEVSAPEGLTVEGGKTGTTNAAGYCLEILVDDQKGNSYIALVLKANNSSNLYNQLNVLMNKIQESKSQ